MGSTGTLLQPVRTPRPGNRSKVRYPTDSPPGSPTALNPGDLSGRGNVFSPKRISQQAAKSYKHLRQPCLPPPLSFAAAARSSGSTFPSALGRGTQSLETLLVVFGDVCRGSERTRRRIRTRLVITDLLRLPSELDKNHNQLTTNPSHRRGRYGPISPNLRYYRYISGACIPLDDDRDATSFAETSKKPAELRDRRRMVALLYRGGPVFHMSAPIQLFAAKRAASVRRHPPPRETTAMVGGAGNDRTRCRNGRG